MCWVGRRKKKGTVRSNSYLSCYNLPNPQSLGLVFPLSTDCPLSVPYHIEAIDVMDIPVLPAPIMLGILEHGDFRTIEYRWFIHVIPDIEIGS
jgi:hypothetical protein